MLCALTASPKTHLLVLALGSSRMRKGLVMLSTDIQRET